MKPTVFWSPVLVAVVLSPALLQSDCTPKTGNANLVSLELEAGGIDRVVGFDPATNAYKVWLDGATTMTVRGEAEDATSELRWSMNGLYGPIGVGSGELTFDTPDDGSILTINVLASGGRTNGFSVAINPLCTGGECDDNNSCTSDACVAGACGFTALTDGNACLDQDSIEGICTGAFCNTAPLAEAVLLPNPSDPCDSLEDQPWVSCRLLEASQLGALPRTIELGEADQLAEAIATVMTVVSDAASTPVSDTEYDALVGPSEGVCGSLMGGLSCLEIIDLPMEWPWNSEGSAPPISSAEATVAKAASAGINTGWTASRCFTPGFGIDADGDGLRDDCEFQLAAKLQPSIQFHSQEDLTARRTYWAVDPAGPGTVEIFYALSYLQDGGCAWLPPTKLIGACLPHNGDSEWIRMIASNKGGSLWGVDEIKLSAHYGKGIGDRTGIHSFPVPNARPKTYASWYKHANFVDSVTCNFKSPLLRLQDQCDNGGPLQPVGVYRGRNLGSRACPRVNAVQADESGNLCDNPGCRTEKYWDEASFCGWQSAKIRCPQGYSGQMAAQGIGNSGTDCSELCNGNDRDGDGLVDCSDPDCCSQLQPECCDQPVCLASLACVPGQVTFDSVSTDVIVFQFSANPSNSVPGVCEVLNFVDGVVPPDAGTISESFFGAHSCPEGYSGSGSAAIHASLSLDMDASEEVHGGLLTANAAASCHLSGEGSADAVVYGNVDVNLFVTGGQALIEATCPSITSLGGTIPGCLISHGSNSYYAQGGPDEYTVSRVAGGGGGGQLWSVTFLVGAFAGCSSSPSGNGSFPVNSTWSLRVLPAP